MKIKTLLLILLLVMTLAPAALAQDAPAEEEIPSARILNEQGGPASITGEVNYTNGFFTLGVAEPMVILEDQAGFIDRDRGFLIAQESQVLGKITSDFYTSPFTYRIDLPIEPAGTLRDVDQDDEEDTGVMVYAIAYWTNTWGDPYLEERDLYGGGWSSAYASTRVDPNPSAKAEIIGGKFLIFAPEEGQGFPSGFGEDGRLFTADDPIVVVPQGYTVVNLESDPFTFDRSRRPVINLIEGEGSEQEDYSNLSYTEAFDALVELFRETYAYTELKEIDWDAKLDEFRPMFEQAEEDVDVVAYQLALRDFIWSIPDGHLSAPFDQNQFAIDTAGGLGIAARELDDGRVLVNFLLPDSPADEAGIELRAELLELNGQPVQEVIPTIQPWSLPFSADHTLRLQQLRYMLRSQIGTEVEVTYQNPGDDEPTTVTLTSIPERVSFAFSSFNAGLTGAEQPIEFRPLDNGYGYVKIYSFSDNDLLSIQLWERMIRYLNGAGTAGLIIDMRQNGGGSGFLADQMAAYFYQEALVLGNSESYDESLGRFYADPDLEQRFFLPPPELRYDGPIAVLVGPNCNSACEYFTYNMTLEDRAAIVGQYPTAGLGGGQTTYLMPGGLQLQYSFTRSVGPDGEIIIEGTGVEPTVRVPVDEETLFSETDPILDGAVAYLDDLTAIDLVDGGEIAVGETVTGEVVERQRVRYTLTFEEEGVVSIFLTDEANDLDTVLRIYNAAGQLLAENDDAEVGVPAPNSSLTALEVPADLTVLVEVGTYEDAFAGSYTLEVRSAE